LAPRPHGGSPPREPRSRSTIDPIGPSPIALVGELDDNGCATSAFSADVSDGAQTHELVGAVVSDFGGLDLLVSNAGVEHFGALDITQADFDRLFQTKWPDKCLSLRQRSPR
jgi:NAD(P)-dependent dehydrogenase (short-subunit alcohol dehydrogenase family)